MARQTACLCLRGGTMPTTSDMETKQEGLEPCEGRLSCTVLRGLGYGNIPWLPGASGNGSCLAFGAKSAEEQPKRALPGAGGALEHRSDILWDTSCIFLQ
jgi:hypothetical protein